VSVRIVGEARTLPPGVDLAAYRVVQEALTNALKYAVGARGEVTVTYGPDDLTVEVLDDGGPAEDASTGGEDPPGAGRGLLGLAERLGLYGGELHAGRPCAGGYRVHARIPVNVR
jgi:signal transduction histidine kinase